MQENIFAFLYIACIQGSRFGNSVRGSRTRSVGTCAMTAPHLLVAAPHLGRPRGRMPRTPHAARSAQVRAPASPRRAAPAPDPIAIASAQVTLLSRDTVLFSESKRFPHGGLELHARTLVRRGKGSVLAYWKRVKGVVRVQRPRAEHICRDMGSSVLRYRHSLRHAAHARWRTLPSAACQHVLLRIRVSRWRCHCGSLPRPGGDGCLVGDACRQFGNVHLRFLATCRFHVVSGHEAQRG